MSDGTLQRRATQKFVSLVTWKCHLAFKLLIYWLLHCSSLMWDKPSALAEEGRQVAWKAGHARCLLRESHVTFNPSMQLFSDHLLTVEISKQVTIRTCRNVKYYSCPPEMWSISCHPLHWAAPTLPILEYTIQWGESIKILISVFNVVRLFTLHFLPNASSWWLPWQSLDCAVYFNARPLRAWHWRRLQQKLAGR